MLRGERLCRRRLPECVTRWRRLDRLEWLLERSELEVEEWKREDELELLVLELRDDVEPEEVVEFE